MFKNKFFIFKNKVIYTYFASTREGYKHTLRLHVQKGWERFFLRTGKQNEESNPGGNHQPTRTLAPHTLNPKP